jgi:CubicO group peptidase (beta-lactamase class C family)
MVRNRFVVAALLVCLAAKLQAATHAEQIDALLKKFNANRQFNGAALVAEKGNVILKNGYGMANFEWQIPNTPDTKFRLGSITKQFTSMLVMQLVAEGKIKLDEKMTTYLPDYRKDTGDRITVRMLLNHTSGIPSYTSRPDIREISRTPVNVNEFVKKYASGDLEFEPGTKWAYNNSGYFILGAMLEKVAGKPYEQQLKERIFDPIGMDSTGYDHRETILPKRASGYILGPAGYRNAAYLDMSVPYAAGSLYSTVEDLFKWDRALYTDKLLAPQFKAMLWTPGLQHYGFGWLIDTMTLDDEKTKAAFVAHNGGIDGFSTSLVRFPDTQDFVVLLDNTSRGDVLDDIGKSIADILHDIDPPAARPSIADEIRTGANVQEMVKRYRELKATKPAAYNFRETELNRVGYELLQSGRAADAIEIFKLNVEAFPKSWNVYDSLGEAYMTHGDHDLALANYRKSLELNGENANAKEMIRRMEKPVVTLAPALLDRYVGEYELSPGFVLSVTHEGARLFVQATGQRKFELVPESETEFNVSIVKARVTFSTAPDGAITLTLHQGGRDASAKKK